MKTHRLQVFYLDTIAEGKAEPIGSIVHELMLAGLNADTWYLFMVGEHNGIELQEEHLPNIINKPYPVNVVVFNYMELIDDNSLPVFVTLDQPWIDGFAPILIRGNVFTECIFGVNPSLRCLYLSQFLKQEMEDGRLDKSTIIHCPIHLGCVSRDLQAAEIDKQIIEYEF